MSDVFDEINEELKRDRARALWDKYGRYVILIVVLIVAVVAGRQGWISWQENRSQSAAEAFSAAATATDPVAALANLDVPSGYRQQADFARAAALLGQGNGQEAAAIYRQIASDSQQGAIYANLALYLAVSAEMASADAAKLADLQSQIAGLADTAGPLQGLSLELSAALHIMAGDKSSATEVLDRLLTLDDITASLRQRANLLRIALGQS